MVRTRWKMLAGKFYFEGKRYAKGDVFEATTKEVQGVRDIIEDLDKVGEYQATMDDDVPRKKLVAVHRGFGKWDVLNTTTGKAINDHPLTKTDARLLVDEMEDVEVQVAPVAPPMSPTQRAAIVIEEEAKDGTSKPATEEKAIGDTKVVDRKRRVLVGRGSKPK